MELELLSKQELIVELKNLRLENEILKKKQSETLEAVKILVMKVSHEMKTPLNSIIGFSEFFKSKTDNEKFIRYLDNILTASRHMLSLIQNLIDITKSQHKPMELSYSIFNTGQTIEEVIKGFQNESIKYTVIDTTLCADYTRFKQLIYNLIANAIKYNRQNKVINILTFIDSEEFYFEISDNGEGIKKEDFEKIFEFYSQVSQDLNKRQIGSGIGLALCKTIAEAHKGKIWVTSTLGKGSTFTFKIPININ